MDTIKGVLDMATAANASALCNPDVENMEAPNTDRIDSVQAPNTTLVTQSDVNQSDHGLAQASQPFVNVALDSGDLNPQRFVPIKYGEWDTTHTNFNVINTIHLPIDMTYSKYPLGRIAQQYQAMRSGWEFNLVVNTSPGYRGGLVLMYYPAGVTLQEHSTMSYQNFPHVILNASISTSSHLIVPYTAQKPFAGITTRDAGSLILFVLSTLTMPTGSAATVEYTIYARAVKPQFIGLSVLQAPGGKGKKKRSRRLVSSGCTTLTRVEEGECAAYMSSYNHTKYRPAMSLCGETTKFDTTQAGSKKVDDLVEVAKIPSVYEVTDWPASSVQGTQLVAFDMRVDEKGGYYDKQLSNLTYISSHFKYYSGSISITFQAFASKLSQGRLLAVFQPSVSPDHELVATLNLDQTSNMYCMVMDLGLNSTFTFQIPYVSTQPIRPTGERIGRVHLLVLNRLTYTTASPQTAEIVIYTSAGNDFKLYYPKLGSTKQGDDDDNPWDTDWDTDDEEQGDVPLGSIENSGEGTYTAGPSFSNLHMTSSTILSVSHTKVKWFTGRASFCGKYTIPSGYKVMNLHALGGTPLNLLLKNFVFRNGDLTLTVVPLTPGVFTVSVAMGEDGFMVDPPQEDNGFLAFASSEGTVTSFGNRPVSMKVPYYCRNPLLLNQYEPLAKVLVTTTSDMVLAFFMATTSNTGFYFLKMPPEVPAVQEIDSDEDNFCDTFKEGLLLGPGMSSQKQIIIDDDDVAGLGASNSSLLKCCGDVESNPGPEFRKPWTSVEAEAIRQFGRPDFLFSNRVNQQGLRTISFNENGTEFSFRIRDSTNYFETTPHFFQKEYFAPVWIKPGICEFIAEMPDIPWFGPPINHPRGEQFWLKMIFVVQMEREVRKHSCITNKQLLAFAGDVEENPGPIYLARENDWVFHDEGLTFSVQALEGRWVFNIVTAEEIMRHGSLVPLNEEVMEMAINLPEANIDVDFETPNPPEVYVVLAMAILLFRNTKEANWRINFLSWITGIDIEAVQKAATISQSFSLDTIQRLLGDIRSASIMSYIKPFVKMCCYISILASNQSPGVLVGTFGLMGLDGVNLVQYVRDTLRTIIIGDGYEGHVKELLMKHFTAAEEEILERYGQPNKELNPTFGDITTVTHSFKSLAWWMDLVADLVKKLMATFSPTKVDEARKAAHEDKLKETMVMADYYIWKKNLGKLECGDYPIIRKTAKTLGDYLARMEPLAGTVDYKTLRDLMGKIVPACKHTDQAESTRPEPLGIHFMGNPGCGKSVLCARLCATLSALMKTSVYNFPFGSEYFDGYTDQGIMYIDDFLQSTNEKDAELICQLISTSTFKVPMAECADKNTESKIRLVVASGNCKPKPMTAVKSPDAIARRFKKFELMAKPEYLVEKNGSKVFCIDFAKADGSFDDGRCWEIKDEDGQVRTLSIQRLLRDIMVELEHKKVVHKTMEDIVKDDVRKYVNKKQGPLDDEDLDPDAFERLRLRMYEDSMGGTNLYPTVIAPTEEQVKSCRGMVQESKNNPLVRETLINSLKMTPQEFIDFEKNLDTLYPEPESKEDDPDDWIKLKRSDSIGSDMDSWMSDEEYASRRGREVKQAVNQMFTWDCFSVLAMFAVGLFSLSAVVGLVRNMIWVANGIVGLFKKDGDSSDSDSDKERAYAGAMSSKTHSKRIVRKENAYHHFCKNMIEIKAGGTTWKGLAMGDQNFLTFTHAQIGGDISIIGSLGVINVSEDDYELEDLVYNHGGKSELTFVRVNVPLPFKYKLIYSSLCNPHYGKGGVILKRCGNYINSERVSQAQYTSSTNTADDDVLFETTEWFGHSKNGDCGSIYVQEVKGRQMIVGMHVAGRFGVVVSANLGMFQNTKEGTVIMVEPAKKVFCKAVTKLRESPLHGVVEVKMQPAVLHPNDPRLEVKVDNLVKSAESKHVGNVYNVDKAVMSQVFDYWTTKWKKLGVVKAMEVGPEEAILGCGSNPIEMNTSAGIKYVERGLTKYDLFKIDCGVVTMTEDFRKEVMEGYERVGSGQIMETEFCTYLKDELRKNKKISEGKTRAIESCSVDFTVVYRMFCGALYKQIYDLHPVYSGLSVGINPLEASEEVHRVWSKYKHIFSGDFASFDGSLSAELLEKAVLFLSQFCERPKCIEVLHKSIIDKKIRVFDEVWTVHGSMASGAPCTSVLNSVCNMLATTYVFVQCGGNLDDYEMMSYGDDVVWMTNGDIEIEKWTDTFMNCFGMTITDTKKTGHEYETGLEKTTFLKRSFVKNIHCGWVLALEQEAIIQSLMWCRGSVEFDQKMDNLAIELAAYGWEIYEEWMDKFNDYMRESPFVFPPYGVAADRLETIVNIW